MCSKSRLAWSFLGVLALSFTYVLLVVLVVTLLSFPGIGVVLVPQPFLKLVVGRWTMFYDFTDPSTVVLWVIYVVLIHSALYAAVTTVLGVKRPYVLVGVVIYVVNVVLILLGFSSIDMKLYLLTYTVKYAAAIPGVALVVLAEWLGYKLKSRIQRS